VVWGHATGENYAFIDIHEQSIEGRFEINFLNLRNDLKLKIDAENELQSVQQTAAIVQKHILEHYAIFADGEKLAIHFTRVDILAGKERGFAQYYFTVAVDSMPDELVFQNTLFFDNNPRHRGLLLVAYNHKTQKNYGAEHTALIFSPDNYRQTLDLNDIPRLLQRKQFVWQGILHILVGYDHILFLVVLLLPAVLQRKAGQWQAAAKFRTVLFNFITIVTLFTIAHSITLTMAALGIIKIYPPLVEAVIALSIILVALNNLMPKFNDRAWLLILVFGLFHGLGFASVMGQLPFRMVDLVHVMLYFNIGVEVGQLAIVAVLLPTLYFLSRYDKFYQPAVLKGGSIVIGLIAGAWFIERSFFSYGLG
jgi:hypothetical protein